MAAIAWSGPRAARSAPTGRAGDGCARPRRRSAVDSMSTASPPTSSAADSVRRRRSASTSSKVGRYQATTCMPWLCARWMIGARRSGSITPGGRARVGGLEVERLHTRLRHRVDVVGVDRRRRAAQLESSRTRPPMRRARCGAPPSTLRRRGRAAPVAAWATRSVATTTTPTTIETATRMARRRRRTRRWEARARARPGSPPLHPSTPEPRERWSRRAPPQPTGDAPLPGGGEEGAGAGGREGEPGHRLHLDGPVRPPRRDHRGLHQIQLQGQPEGRRREVAAIRRRRPPPARGGGSSPRGNSTASTSVCGSCSTSPAGTSTTHRRANPCRARIATTATGKPDGEHQRAGDPLLRGQQQRPGDRPGHRGDAGERHGSEEQRGRDAQREPALVAVGRAVDEHVAGERRERRHDRERRAARPPAAPGQPRSPVMRRPVRDGEGGGRGDAERGEAHRRRQHAPPRAPRPTSPRPAPRRCAPRPGCARRARRRARARAGAAAAPT